MVAHRSHTDMYASADVFENLIDDVPGGTLFIDRSHFLLILGTTTGDRTLPSPAGIPLGACGTIVNGYSSDINVVGDEYLAGSSNTTTATMPPDSYLFIINMTSNEQSDRHWRVLYSGGGVTYS